MKSKKLILRDHQQVDAPTRTVLSFGSHAPFAHAHMHRHTYTHTGMRTHWWPYSIKVGRHVATHAAATRSPLRARVGNETDVPGALAVWRQKKKDNGEYGSSRSISY